MKRWPQALSDYSRALELMPGDRMVRWHRTEVLAELGRSKEALAEFRSLGDPPPNLLDEYVSLLQQLGARGEADAMRQRVSSMKPNVENIRDL